MEKKASTTDQDDSANEKNSLFSFRDLFTFSQMHGIQKIGDEEGDAQMALESTVPSNINDLYLHQLAFNKVKTN